MAGAASLMAAVNLNVIFFFFLPACRLAVLNQRCCFRLPHSICLYSLCPFISRHFILSVSFFSPEKIKNTANNQLPRLEKPTLLRYYTVQEPELSDGETVASPTCW